MSGGLPSVSRSTEHLTDLGFADWSVESARGVMSDGCVTAIIAADDAPGDSDACPVRAREIGPSPGEEGAASACATQGERPRVRYLRASTAKRLCPTHAVKDAQVRGSRRVLVASQCSTDSGTR